MSRGRRVCQVRFSEANQAFGFAKMIGFLRGHRVYNAPALNRIASGRSMMGMAETDEKAGRSAERVYGEVLECATNSVLSAASFKAPYPHILFRDFFPGEFYRLLIERFPSVDRFVGLNGGREGNSTFMTTAPTRGRRRA